MEANELRIGNWVKRDLQPEGFQIDSNSFKRCERHPDWYKSIPVSEDWLLKLGFNRHLIDVVYPRYSYMNIETYNCIGTPHIWIIINNGHYITQIKYVHQLQNLYFALTGKELTP